MKTETTTYDPEVIRWGVSPAKLRENIEASDARIAMLRTRKALKLAAVLRRCNAADVAADFTPPIWGLVVELAGVKPHSPTEPVSPATRAVVLVLLAEGEA